MTARARAPFSSCAVCGQGYVLAHLNGTQVWVALGTMGGWLCAGCRLVIA